MGTVLWVKVFHECVSQKLENNINRKGEKLSDNLGRR